MILMMLCPLLLGVTGFMFGKIDCFWGEEWLEEVHTLIADGLAGLVGLHILAALVENLPLSMIDDR